MPGINSGIGRRVDQDAGVSWSSYWKTHSLRDFKEIVKKSDGYYLKDYSSNALDAKLVKSLEGSFTAAQSINLTGSPFDETIALTDNAVNEYEFDIAIDDLTRDISVYDNTVLKNVSYPYVPGFMLRVKENKIEIALSTSDTAAGKQIITSTITIPDSNYHHWKVTVDTRTGARFVTFQIDDTIDTPVAITCNGAVLHGHHNVCTLGGGTSSAIMRLANFRLTVDGTLIYDIPISTNHVRVWDRVTGTINSGNNTNTWTFTNDFYPANCLNGFEYYFNGPTNPFVYVPNRTNGALITPTISVGAKVGAVAYSGYYNYSETQIQPNPTNEAVLTALGYGSGVYWHSYDIMQLISKKIFLHGIQTGITRLAIFDVDQSDANITKIHNTLTNTIVKTGIFFGDSIAAGAGANETTYPLPAYLEGDIANAKILWPTELWTNVPPCKIDFLEVLNKGNDANTRDSGFNTPLLCYSYLFTNTFYVIYRASGGAITGEDTVADNDFCPTNASGHMPQLLQLLNRGIEEIRKNGHEPTFDIFACLGTNDSSYSTAMRDAFATNFTAAIAAIRAVIGDDNDVNLLRVKMAGADTTIVGNLSAGLQTSLSRCYVYDSQSLDYHDGVHPTTTGNIEIATAWYNKTHI